jgi:hypothetical protein
MRSGTRICEEELRESSNHSYRTRAGSWFAPGRWCLSGAPHEAIVAAAKGAKADLIVVGTYGLKRILSVCPGQHRLARSLHHALQSDDGLSGSLPAWNRWKGFPRARLVTLLQRTVNRHALVTSKGRTSLAPILAVEAEQAALRMAFRRSTDRHSRDPHLRPDCYSRSTSIPYDFSFR